MTDDRDDRDDREAAPSAVIQLLIDWGAAAGAARVARARWTRCSPLPTGSCGGSRPAT
jgi:hypothetical protein